MQACRNSSDCWQRGWYFPFENGAVKMDAFAVEGRVIYEIWLWKHFWHEVAIGIAGLNPIKLFSKEYDLCPQPTSYVN